MSEASEDRKPAGRRRRAAPSGAVSVSDRQLPHNLDAEEGVLAAILIDGTKEVINACVALKVREDYFFKPQHRAIYSAILALYSEGSNID